MKAKVLYWLKIVAALITLALLIRAIKGSFSDKNNDVNRGGQTTNADGSVNEAPPEPTPPRRYDLRKDRPGDEAPFTGLDVLWERKDNPSTGHIVLEIPDYLGSRQTLCWLKKYDQPETGRLRKEALALDKTGWAPGNWTTILPNGNPLHGKLLIKELPGGEFRIKKFDPDRRDSTKWDHDYSGTISPDWTAG